MTETRTDVFEEALKYAPVGGEFDWVSGDEAGNLADRMRQRYAAAPAEVVKVPKAVWDYIKVSKFEDVTLLEAMGCAHDPVFAKVSRWITSNDEAFARAYLAWPNVEIEED